MDYPKQPPPPYNPTIESPKSGAPPTAQLGAPPGEPAPNYSQQQYPGPPPPGQGQYPQQPPMQYPVGAYAPPQPGMVVPGGGQQVIVMGPQAVVMCPVNQYGYQAARTNCPYCHADVVTTVEHEVGLLAWMICGIIILVGLIIFPCALLGCCFIPFCIRDCKDVIHSCPACNQVLGRVRRLK